MLESRLEVLTVATGAREVVDRAPLHVEPPNSSRDGGSLLVHQERRVPWSPDGGRFALVSHGVDR